MSDSCNDGCSKKPGGIKAVFISSDQSISLKDLKEINDAKKYVFPEGERRTGVQTVTLILESSAIMFQKGIHPNQYFLEMLYGKPENLKRYGKSEK